ncbi:MAG: ABC transporter substrate-binding protein [Slackia sp.]|nr:ABC transporter substrate-binding protein [Slackia sp.]
MKMKKALASLVCAAMLACGLFVFAGCSNTEPGQASQDDGAQSRPMAMRIGTMQTEDSLPFWVAEQNGSYGDAQVEIVTFQSAQELLTAFAAGEIDAAMTDVQQAAALQLSGTDVRLGWVTLGADASQGRFGIMTSPESGIESLSELAGVGIGVGSNTVPEYVMDKLMEAAGVSADQVVVEEIKKMPVRYESMANNQVAAAALPASLLALGEASGMVLLADDTQGENISQSVLVVRDAWLQDGGASAFDAVRSAWNDAASAIGADPEAYRALLVEKANLPAPVADTYPVSTYPQAEMPTEEMVQPVLDWMFEKGYIAQAMTYDANEGTLAAS